MNASLSPGRAVLFFALVAGGTMLMRFLPFLLFPENKRTPAFAQYLEKVLPYAIIGMLVVYCLRNVSVLRPPFALPELAGIGAVVFLYRRRKNILLAIGGGTLFYMFLAQAVLRCFSA